MKNMNTVGINEASNCEASNVTELHIAASDGLIMVVKSMITACRYLDGMAVAAPGAQPIELVELRGCLYDVSDSEAMGWAPNYYTLTYTPSVDDSLMVQQKIVGKHFDDSYVVSEPIDLIELHSFLLRVGGINKELKAS